MNVIHVFSEVERQSEATLSLMNVGLIVEGKPILEGISFEISAPRIGIVGRNGSGKSALARLFAGLVGATNGELKVNGLNLARDRNAALADVGILFHNPDHQFFFPTVEEEISFRIRQINNSMKEAATVTAAILSEFGKSHWASVKISALSRAQKHLVCVMATVARQPQLIILDEPFSGLDMAAKNQLMRYLSRHRGGLIHISNDPIELLEYEKVIWLDEGRLESTGDAVPVLENYIARMKELGEGDGISKLTQ